MAQGTVIVMKHALDPIGYFVIAIIIFNIVSSIVKGLKTALGRARKSADAEASQRLTQSLQRPPATAQAAASARAAELARLRKALLASAGVPDADVAATPAPAFSPLSRPPLVIATVAPAKTPTASPASMAAQADQSPAAWSLQNPGTLMSLESATTAFNQLATPGSAAAAAQSAAARASGGSALLAVLAGPNSGTNLFVAAAIVGPCAALRSLGHTPGGW